MDPAGKMDGRVERGDRTRQQILDAAVDIASVEGLEGLSIGRLALKLEMSKSGLFAAFGSKQDLQRAKDEGHLQAGLDSAQLAFEIDSLAQGANLAYQLFGNATAFDRARRATKARLDAASAPARRSGRRAAHRKPAATGH